MSPIHFQGSPVENVGANAKKSLTIKSDVCISFSSSNNLQTLGFTVKTPAAWLDT